MKELQGHTHLIICCDGGCWGNPGPAAIGVVFYSRQLKRLAAISEQIGYGTNNFAEYRAVIKGMELAHQAGAVKIAIYSDSRLIVEQIMGRWVCNPGKLRALYDQARSLRTSFQQCTLTWIPRERNAICDQLAQAALKGESPRRTS